MRSEDFDVIVIGAGLAGLCCAGELMLAGARPLLICEAKEVGFALKSHMVGGNRGLSQVPTWQVGWGGGWWPTLVRQLNVPVRTPLGFGQLDNAMALKGEDAATLPQCALSGESAAGAFVEGFPFLAEYQKEIGRVLDAALGIPYPELVKMHRTPLAQWLQDMKCDELVSDFLIKLGGFVSAASSEFCRNHISVSGAFGYFRSMFCGEATYGLPYPDNRHGLAIPLAREIENRGGVIRRGGKVHEILMKNGRADGIAMDDGTEARAPIVAFACGNDRIAKLLDPIPPELEASIAYSEKTTHLDFTVFAVIEGTVVPRDKAKWVAAVDFEDGLLEWTVRLHDLAPWTTQPGKQFLCAERIL
ncbi:FAD-binding protein [Mycobacterium branderi]|nr:FAD-binding protein [Mycobacterium branderi]MCV7231724.1 FAD-binding protein [Mycobacterium branderi]